MVFLDPIRTGLSGFYLTEDSALPEKQQDEKPVFRILAGRLHPGERRETFFPCDSDIHTGVIPWMRLQKDS